ncbi:MAG: amidohydrolase [Ardenticatenaceae bacterium]|nr:amidohydrolase [Ardenticatenaceae bacterium]
MLEKAKALQAELSRLRRTIHMHPELGFEEFQTGALVAQTLSDLGIEMQTGVAKTGIIGRIGNGNGPVIGIRADMDALPILEANDVAYKSQVPGKMHACGHDSHTTMLLGAAMLLKDVPFDGEIRLIFQPSEERQDDEGKSGGMRMVEEQALEGLDAVIGLHVIGMMDRGQVMLDEGFVLANVDTIYAKVKGKGGHGAQPHLSRDPIFMMGPILTALHGIVSRWVSPTEPAVVTVGKMVGGTVNNVIPSEVELEITCRSLNDDVREQLVYEVEQALSIARNLGGDYEMRRVTGYPALYNDPKVVGWLKETAVEFLGADNVHARGPSMGGEDFAYMSRASQGAMIFLGVKDPAGPPRFLHHPEFDLDETAMPIGAALLAETALRFVNKRYQ